MGARLFAHSLYPAQALVGVVSLPEQGAWIISTLPSRGADEQPTVEVQVFVFGATTFTVYYSMWDGEDWVDQTGVDGLDYSGFLSELKALGANVLVMQSSIADAEAAVVVMGGTVI